MIITLLLNVIVLFVGSIFIWLPKITTLPNILGYDIDGALVSGMGSLNSFMESVWPLQLLFQGFLVLMAYYLIKMGLKFFLGHRAPGKH